MKYNFKSQAISTIIADLPKNEAWWVGTDSEKYIVPVQAVFEALERECDMVAPFNTDFDNVRAEIAKLARVKPDDVQSGNTYNGGDNLSNHLCYYSAEGDDGYYIAFAIHRAGDVRCNYTDFAIFRFGSFEHCWETILEVSCDCITDLTVDGKMYSIRPEPVSECYDVWCADDDFQTELLPDDITDEAMAQAIREARTE